MTRERSLEIFRRTREIIKNMSDEEAERIRIAFEAKYGTIQERRRSYQEYELKDSPEAFYKMSSNEQHAVQESIGFAVMAA